MSKAQPIHFLGDYIQGRFVRNAKADSEWEIKSPADLKEIVMTVSSQVDHVDHACRAAKQAFGPWAALTMDERKKFFHKLKEVYVAHKQLMAETISRETGKPLWDSEGEVQAMIGKIDITLESSVLLVQDQVVPNALPNIRGITRFKPRGVMAVVGPFNFPGHLPNGHIIPALITGNTVVFKPSEFTPAIAQLMAQLFEKAEFPPGVFNVVHGKGDVGKTLVCHELVEGVLFTGSYETGLKIKQETMNHFWKILALEMGGKNASIVWDSANMEKAIYENLVGSFLTTGQRCSCTSRLILHKKIADEFLEKYHLAAKKLKIGHWKNQPFMGPLINEASYEKYLRFQGIAGREGAECLMRGKALELETEGYYVTPSIHLVKTPNPESVFQKSEIFGPCVAVYFVDDFDQALALNNSSSYGLVLSVFAQERELYERAVRHARVGLVNWNRSTAGASSKLPFGGMGKSGNDRASAHFAVYYSTVPVASLEDETSFDKTKIFPGIEL